MLAKIKQDAFWTSATLPVLDDIRCRLRELMQYLKKEMKMKVINVTDSVLLEKEGERFTEDTTLEAYYQRAERYVQENEGKPSIQKLKNNEPLTDEDWNELEEIFWHEVGSKDDYDREAGAEMPLGRFVRGITGLSQEAALAAFSEFLDGQCYTEEQIRFVRCVIDWIVKWGTLEDEDMKNDEFCGGIDFMEAFEDNITALQTIIGRIRSINENAMRKAA